MQEQFQQRSLRPVRVVFYGANCLVVWILLSICISIILIRSSSLAWVLYTSLSWSIIKHFYGRPIALSIMEFSSFFNALMIASIPIVLASSLREHQILILDFHSLTSVYVSLTGVF